MTKTLSEKLNDAREVIHESVEEWVEKNADPKKLRKKIFARLDKVLESAINDRLGLRTSGGQPSLVAGSRLDQHFQKKAQDLASEWLELVLEKMRLPSPEAIAHVVREDFSKAFRTHINIIATRAGQQAAEDALDRVLDELRDAELAALGLSEKVEADELKVDCCDEERRDDLIRR